VRLMTSTHNSAGSLNAHPPVDAWQATTAVFCRLLRVREPDGTVDAAGGAQEMPLQHQTWPGTDFLLHILDPDVSCICFRDYIFTLFLLAFAVSTTVETHMQASKHLDILSDGLSHTQTNLLHRPRAMNKMSHTVSSTYRYSSATALTCEQ
jgi:hypothetical protein